LGFLGVGVDCKFFGKNIPDVSMDSEGECKVLVACKDGCNVSCIIGTPGYSYIFHSDKVLTVVFEGSTTKESIGIAFFRFELCCVGRWGTVTFLNRLVIWCFIIINVDIKAIPNVLEDRVVKLLAFYCNLCSLYT